MNELNELVWETAEELDKKLAERIRRIRKRRSISQQELAVMSGVSYGSIKRFEGSGQISLLSLTKIAMALELTDARSWASALQRSSLRRASRESLSIRLRYLHRKSSTHYRASCSLLLMTYMPI